MGRERTAPVPCTAPAAWKGSHRERGGSTGCFQWKGAMGHCFLSFLGCEQRNKPETLAWAKTSSFMPCICLDLIIIQ